MTDKNISIQSFLVKNALDAITMLKSYAEENNTTVGDLLGEAAQQQIAKTVLTGGEFAAVLWSVSDVSCLDANISQQDARKVLDLAIKNHDQCHGISIDTFLGYINNHLDGINDNAIQ